MLQIAEALFEITLPRFSGDVLPKTDAGIVLSIADRLIISLFPFGILQLPQPLGHFLSNSICV